MCGGEYATLAYIYAYDMHALERTAPSRHSDSKERKSQKPQRETREKQARYARGGNTVSNGKGTQQTHVADDLLLHATTKISNLSFIHYGLCHFHRSEFASRVRSPSPRTFSKKNITHDMNHECPDPWAGAAGLAIQWRFANEQDCGSFFIQHLFR